MIRQSFFILALMIVGTMQCFGGDDVMGEQKKTQSSLVIETLCGVAIQPYRFDLGALRMDLFKEFPYLYDGGRNEHTRALEENYHETYSKSKNSRFVIAKDHDKVVGCLTAIPLSEEMDELQKPFLEANHDVSRYLYVGEALLLKEYRGKAGLAQTQQKLIEAYAREKGFSFIVFMTVDRPEDHPLKPKDYRDLDPMWRYLGYEKMDDTMKIHIPWIQIDGDEEQMNTLSIWRKAL